MTKTPKGLTAADIARFPAAIQDQIWRQLAEQGSPLKRPGASAPKVAPARAPKRAARAVKAPRATVVAPVAKRPARAPKGHGWLLWTAPAAAILAAILFY